MRLNPEKYSPTGPGSSISILADKLSAAGWSWGCVSAVDSNGHTIWIADAHRGDGKRFVVRADEKLTAFLELEAAISKNSIDTFCRRRPESHPG